MQLSCTHEHLGIALSYLEWVVGKQSHLPILSNILFEAEAGKLRLCATNLEIGVTTVVPAKVEEEGKMVIPVKVLLNFVHNIDPDQIVHIQQEGSQMVIENGKDEIRIQSMESKDFPIIPEYTGEYPVTMEGGVFEETLRRVVFAASTNESRMELTGVALTLSLSGVSLAATDSFRLAEYTPPIIEGQLIDSLTQLLEVEGGTLIFPVDTLQELGRIIQANPTLVSMALAESQLFFRIGDTQVVSRIIQGRYPDYRQIIPTEFQQTVRVPKPELVRALKMATSFAQYSGGEVKCHFLAEESMLEISTLSSGIGEQRTRISLGEGVMEEREFVFQARHLLEGVNVLNGESITFRMNGKDAPALLSGVDGEKHFYLVMPIRK